MKDLVQIWNRVTSKQYTSSEREMGEMPNNRLKKGDIDTSTFEANFSECEGLNNKFNDDLEFSDRKDDIINRLFERRKKGQMARWPKGELRELFVYTNVLQTSAKSDLKKETTTVRPLLLDLKQVKFRFR